MKTLLGAILLLCAAPPALAQETAGRTWASDLDLRTLPPGTRPAVIEVAVDAARAAQAGARPLVTLALNGDVVERRFASGDGPTTLRHHPEDRLLSIRNQLEVAVTLPFCSGEGCADALETVRLSHTPRAQLEPLGSDLTNFAQLPTRLRSGIAIGAETSRGRQLAEMARAVLAPAAPLDERAAARIVVGDRPPEGTNPRLRFDRGPVALRRSDGAPLISAAALDRLTVVQLLGTAERPLLWIRPGDRLPAQLDLDHGDVALFDESGRVFGFSTQADRAVEVAYAPGADPHGQERATQLWRLALLAFWILLTIGTVLVLRRLPPTPRATRTEAG